MPEKEERTSLDGKENAPASEENRTVTKGPAKAPQTDHTLTLGKKTPSENGRTLTKTSGRTLTLGERKTPRTSLTLTPGTGTRTRRTGTMTRTIGAGTGELVDKVNWEIGDVIDGRFKVNEIIGQGGMGIVYKVHHFEWNLDLAVKMPLAHLVADESSKTRFIREAQTWVDLGLHPNIVQCLYVREFGKMPRVFMEYVSGGSLKDWISDGKVKPGEWEKILDLTIQACDGLGYAHEQGVEVHRDVKPGNMLLTEKGDLLVTDFGIAKRVGWADVQKNGQRGAPKDGRSSVTQTGSELGTPEYGAPEQWGKAGEADARADIYALGVILFELCCGRRPFDDGTHSEPAQVLIGRHLSMPSPDPKTFNVDLPSALAEIIRQCLAKEPKLRPASMTALRKALTDIYAEIFGKHYRRAVPQAADLRSDALNNKAVSLLDLGQRSEALAAWSESLKLDAYHPESIYNSSVLYWRECKITDEDAISQLKEAKQAGRRADVYLGYLHLERGAADEAEMVFRQALEDPELARSGTVWRALADALLTQTKYAEAEDAYRKALALIPEDTESVERQTLSQNKIRFKANKAILSWKHCACSLEGGHRGSVTSVAITTDGRYAISGSVDRTLRLWNLTTRECLRAFKGHEDAIRAVAMTPNGKWVVSGSQDKSVRLWEIATGKCLWIGKKHTDWVSAIIITPDGRYAISGSYDNTMRKWELTTGKCLWATEEKSTRINTLAMTADARYILSGHEEENLYLWDAITGKRTERKYYGSRLELLGLFSYAVSALVITADGKFAVAGNQDGSVRLWNINTGEVSQTFKGHEGNVTSVALTPDGRWILSGGEDTNLLIWDMETGENLWTLEGHTDAIMSVKITPDGKFAISAGKDNTLKIWHLETHECVWTFWGEQGHQSGVTTLAMALHGRFVVAGSQDFSLSLWDLLTARCLRMYKGHTREVSSVAVTPDGRRAISGSHDGTLRLWELGTTTCLRIFSGHKKEVTAVKITPDGKNVVSGSVDKTLRLWDIETAECLQVFKGHKDTITTVNITPDSRFLISGSHDKILRLWELATGKCVRVFRGHTRSVNALAVVPGGQFFISGGHDNMLRLWNLVTGNCLRIFAGHQRSITSVETTPDGKYVVSGSEDGTMRLWDIETTRCLRTFTGHQDGVSSVVVSQDGQWAISGSKDTSLRLWDLDRNAHLYEASLQLCRQRNHEEMFASSERFRKRMTWAETAWSNGKAAVAYRYLTQVRAIPGYERAPELLTLKAALADVLPRKSLIGEWSLWTLERHSARVNAVAVTPNNRFIVSASKDMTLRLWNLSTAKCLRVFDEHWLGINTVAMTPDGRFAVSGSEDTTLQLWDLVSGKCLRKYEGHTEDVLGVAASPCGRFLASASQDGTLRIWNPSTTECLQCCGGHKQGVTAVIFTPDSRGIISASLDKTVRLWNRSTGKCLRIFEGHKKGVAAVAISQDGRLLVSGSHDMTLRLWDVATAKCLKIFKGHEGEITSAAMTADMRFLASGSQDGTVMLWDIATGEPVRTLRGHKQGVLAVTLTSNGRFIITGSEDKTIRVWEFDWELDINEPAPIEKEESGKTSRFFERITAVFKSDKK